MQRAVQMKLQQQQKLQLLDELQQKQQQMQLQQQQQQQQHVAPPLPPFRQRSAAPFSASHHQLFQRVNVDQGAHAERDLPDITALSQSSFAASGAAASECTSTVETTKTATGPSHHLAMNSDGEQV